MGHPCVPYPYTTDVEPSTGWHDRFLTWVSDHVLPSKIMFDIALIVPLFVLPMPDGVKLVMSVIASSWIQWWALPALQRSQLKADKKRDAKADADHAALTHVAETLDEIKKLLDQQGGAKA